MTCRSDKSPWILPRMIIKELFERWNFTENLNITKSTLISGWSSSELFLNGWDPKITENSALNEAFFTTFW